MCALMCALMYVRAYVFAHVCACLCVRFNVCAWGQLVVDDLEQHKKVWDATERALLGMYGVEMAEMSGNLAAANSEMRAFYAAL